MSASITSSVCALCRRPLPPDDTAGSATRLCDNCRKMVDNIRPATTRPAVSPATNTTLQQTEPPGNVQASSQQPSNLGFESAQLHPQPAANPATINRPDPAWAEMPPTQESSPNPVWAPPARQESPAKPTRQEAGRPDSGSQPKVGKGDTVQQPPTPNGRGFTPRREPPANPGWSDVVMVPSGPDSREAPFQSAAEQSAYQQNWPLIVEETPAKKRGKGVFILVLLVAAGLSAVVGFIVFKDRFFGPRSGAIAGPGPAVPNRVPAAQDNKPPDPRTAQPNSSAKPVTPASAQPPELVKSPATSGPASVDGGKPQPGGQVSQPSQTNPPATAATTQGSGGAVQASGAKTISLQAASFPSESSAKQFQDKLVKAGLPAYIVAADIPHRGRWYRVRAGKFANQEEARQAAQAFHKQAAAASINLQLVPCDY